MLQELSIAVDGDKPEWIERLNFEKEKLKKHDEMLVALQVSIGAGEAFLA